MSIGLTPNLAAKEDPHSPAILQPNGRPKSKNRIESPLVWVFHKEYLGLFCGIFSANSMNCPGNRNLGQCAKARLITRLILVSISSGLCGPSVIKKSYPRSARIVQVFSWE